MDILLKLYPKLNLGDDLFLKMICERYPEHNFHLLAGEKYNKFTEQWSNLFLISPQFKDDLVNKGLRAIGRRFMPSLFREKLQLVYRKQYRNFDVSYDAFVSIGGSIFMQKAENLFLDNELAFYDLIKNVLAGTPKFFIGCNFGPFKTDNYVESYREVFRNAEDVCFREKYSYDLFKELPNVRVAPDVVFGLPTGVPVERNQESIGFSLVSPRGNIDGNKYYNKVAELVSKYQSLGKNIFFFSFCKHEGDEEAINSVIDRVDNSKTIRKVFYNGNIDEFLQVYRQMHTVFCGRFHAMILSMLYSHRIYPIVYSEKMTNVLTDVGFQGGFVKLSNLHEKEVDQIMDEIERVSYDISSEKRVAPAQFDSLDKYLGT